MYFNYYLDGKQLKARIEEKESRHSISSKVGINLIN